MLASPSPLPRRPRKASPAVFLLAAHGLLAFGTGSAAHAAAAEKAHRIGATEDPLLFRLGKEDLALDALPAALAALPPADVIVLQEAQGLALPARALLPAVDRALRSGIPVRLEGSRRKGAFKPATGALTLESWTAEAPPSTEVCLGGELPATFAVRGLLPLLATDLRGAVQLDRDGASVRADAYPEDLLAGKTVPGEPGRSATIAVAIGPGAKVFDLYLLLDRLRELGAGRALLLLQAGESETGGLLVSLHPEGDRPSSLPHRAKPLGPRDPPAYRAMRLLVEEAMLALRLSMQADGTLPKDDEFSAAENTALTLMTLIGAGVRAGDGTAAGDAVLALERWLMAWPPDKRQRVKRREQAIVGAALLEAYGRTRHPLLKNRAEDALREIAKELESDPELRDGIVKGFEGIGIHWAKLAGLDGADAAATRLIALIDGVLNHETGELKATWSTRNSSDYPALALALVTLAKEPTTAPKIQFMAAQAGAELPSPDSTLSNTNRAFGAFFSARLAVLDGGEMLEKFGNALTESLPRTAPAADRDYEKLGSGDVRCPWSGGGPLQSPGRVSLMAMTYQFPTLAILARQVHQPSKR